MGRDNDDLEMLVAPGDDSIMGGGGGLPKPVFASGVVMAGDSTVLSLLLLSSPKAKSGDVCGSQCVPSVMEHVSDTGIQGRHWC
jgi:hypothetical protein